MADLDADVIVIGSGSGGLASALSCAQAGLKVIVFEQHYVSGGWCQSFSRGGFRFSPGVHYIGSLEKGQDTRKIYEGLGVGGDLTFYEMNPNGYEHCMLNGQAFSYSNDFEVNRERFLAQFPHESAGIKSYLEILRRVMDQFPLMLEVNGFKEAITVPFRTKDVGRYGLFSLQYLLDGFIKDKALKAMLSIQCGDQGMSPAKTMFMLHAGVSRHYEHGGYYPKGGGNALAQALVKRLRMHGGRVKRGKKIDQILVERSGSRRRAIGIRVGDKTFRANHIISNADPDNTYLNLVGREHISKRLQKRLAKTKYSTSSLMCFLAVDMDLRQHGMDSGNIWYGTNSDVNELFAAGKDPELYDRETFPALFISAPTLKDPTSYDGRHHTLEVIAFVDHQPFAAFKSAKYGENAPEYLKLKARIEDMFLKTLENVIPTIRKHIVFCEVGTPTTIHHYVRSTNGNVYGTEKSYGQIGPMSYRSKSEIENLYLVGASTAAHGVAGAATTGLNAAAKILGCKWREILKDHGQQIKILSAEGLPRADADAPQPLNASLQLD